MARPRPLLAAAAIVAALWAETAAAETVTYAYDSLGRLTSATYIEGGVTKTITYAYDLAGNRTQVAVTQSTANNPPIAVNDSAYTPNNTAISIPVLANDSDPESNPLTVTAKTNGSLGTVVIDNPPDSVTYTPNSTAGGSDAFTYTVSDGQGGSAVGTVTVTINRLPDAVNDTKTTAYNSASVITVLANDSDADSDPLTVTNVSTPAHGSASINSGTTVTYTPTSGYSGADSFTYTISDGKGGTDTATVSMTVQGQNQNPVAVNDTAVAFKLYTGGAAVRPTVTLDPRGNDSDPNGDSLTVTAVGTASQGTTSFTSGSVTWTSSATYTAPYSGSTSFTYTISDGNGGTAQATVTVSIVVETND